MCARELIFDELPVLLAHGASCEYIAEITQSRGNTHQRYAKVTQLYFDRVEEPDGTHCPAPFFTSHITYLGSSIDLFVRFDPHPTRRLDATSLSEKRPLS
jgi:hypothetical protein